MLSVSVGGERKVASTMSSASAKHTICAGWRLSCIKSRSRAERSDGILPQLPNKKPMFPVGSPRIDVGCLQNSSLSAVQSVRYTGEAWRSIRRSATAEPSVSSASLSSVWLLALLSPTSSNI